MKQRNSNNKSNAGTDSSRNHASPASEPTTVMPVTRRRVDPDTRGISLSSPAIRAIGTSPTRRRSLLRFDKKRPEDEDKAAKERKTRSEASDQSSDESDEEASIEEEAKRKQREAEIGQARKQKEAKVQDMLAKLREPLEVLKAEHERRTVDAIRDAFAKVIGSLDAMAEHTDDFGESFRIANETHAELCTEMAELSDNYRQNVEESIHAISRHLDRLEEAYTARQANRDRFNREVEQLHEGFATKIDGMHKEWAVRKRKLLADMAQANDTTQDEKELRQTLAEMLGGMGD
ncbi:uncharacterized protein PFL1_03269 [Pseudozyma flocculosa PF-1]|uniref:Uncharacterized protein n=2 Tax=Pseudozyma flocculosa TaxID=84751 RepID=A0A5C3F6G7_9BASI|nr:uncharacterized protein PFL1_03269 [Pseudozyma flocculosa PF-1]EPQ28979.1 hypothetical protein PFL1_03269 [Pseudozyma flocculosa PF-1]SPO39972.1 uncharacterized protein PSFLO_05454 [Pseudozyma flocculosa]